MLSVRTETEGYSIIELISDHELYVGDIVSWNEDHPLGDCIIVNHTRNEKIDVYFQNHWVKEADLRRLLLY